MYGEFELVATPFGKDEDVDVVGKLGSMRKPQAFSVRPATDGTLYIQSDKSTGKLNFRTGEGVLNTKGTTFMHLQGLGAQPFTFPPDFVRACLAACPALGSETTVGGVTFVNTVKVLP